MDKLPNELVLDILSYLPYWDLKLRIPAINKQFKHILDLERTSTTRTITKSTKLAQALFCSSAPSSIPQTAQQQIEWEAHPLFQYEKLHLFLPKLTHRSSKIDYPSSVLAENIFSPSVRRLVLSYADFEVSNPVCAATNTNGGSGVTVSDFLQGLCKYVNYVIFAGDRLTYAPRNRLMMTSRHGPRPIIEITGVLPDPVIWYIGIKGVKISDEDAMVQVCIDMAPSLLGSHF